MYPIFTRRGPHNENRIPLASRHGGVDLALHPVDFGVTQGASV